MSLALRAVEMMEADNGCAFECSLTQLEKLDEAFGRDTMRSWPPRLRYAVRKGKHIDFGPLHLIDPSRGMSTVRTHTTETVAQTLTKTFGAALRSGLSVVEAAERMARMRRR